MSTTTAEHRQAQRGVEPGRTTAAAPQATWAVVAVPQRQTRDRVDDLVDRVADELGAATLTYERVRFGNQNILVEVDLDALPKSVEQVLLVAEGSGPTDGDLVEIGLVADAIKRQRRVEVHCLLRYLPYSRSNRITRPGVALGAKVFVDLLCSLPVDAFVTFDLHAPELLGFFSKPVHCLSTLPLAVSALRELGRGYDLVVGTDRGRQDECAHLADSFGCELDFFTKRRLDHTGTVVTLEHDSGRASGRRVLLFDDEIDSGRTAANAARLLSEAGASQIDFLTVYDVAQPGGLDGLAEVPHLEWVVRTNAVVRSPLEDLPVRGRTLDVASLVGGLYLRSGWGGGH